MAPLNAMRPPEPTHFDAWSAMPGEAIEAEFAELGEPRFRAGQLLSALHQRGVSDWEDVTNIPKTLRTRLSDLRPLRSLTIEIDRTSPHDGANKILFRAGDGGAIESVLMRSGTARSRRFTVCVSSQIGCPAACTFCASGLGGLVRNLRAVEIIDQVEVFAGRLLRHGQRLDNVVYMGMGEPFLNYKRVMDSIAQIHSEDGLGIGTRRITVSTVGIIPGIEKFACEPGEVNLAVSLHAPNDELRTRLVPYNRQFPMAALLETVRSYTEKTHRRVSFEYVLLKGTNDFVSMARELAALLISFKPLAHVNLIPWNPFGEAQFSRATRDGAEAFAAQLTNRGIPATIRYSKGLDIDAACGQLRRQVDLQALAS